MTPSQPPRRLLFVLQSTAVGGMETHVIDLCGEFSRRGSAVMLVVPEAAGFDVLQHRGEAAGARVVRLDTDARSGRFAQFGREARLVKLLRTFRPEAVHVHTGGATGGLAPIATARWLTRATVVITEHDVPGKHPGRHQRVARALLDRHCHTVVAVSRRNAALRQSRLPVACANFAAVLNGVPNPALAPGERESNRARVRAELGIPGDAVVAGSLVRLAEGKGLHTLLRAFALAREEQPSHLLLVGDGPLRDELAALAAELGIADVVHFAGNQPVPAPYLDAMDAFVLAVPAGSMSIALLEAMTRGLPPIITFCGPEEAVIPAETGLGAPPDDPQALAAALSQLLGSPVLRRSLGAAAQAHVQRHFSVSRVADDLTEIYAGRSSPLPPRLAWDSPPNPRPGLTLEPAASA